MTDTLQHTQPMGDAEAAGEDAVARLAIRMAIGGFALMFVAASLMWVGFGPAIFVDLATAVVNCF